MMLARFSVKKPYTVIVAILLVIALGAISFMNMTTDLLPSMDLPYVIVYTVYTGSTPEAVESEVTRPLESAFSTLTNIKQVRSTSNENLSLVILEFTSGADMNTAMIEINSEIDQVAGSWDDAIGTPIVMKLNPDMLPVSIVAVSMDDADLLALSDYVTDTLIPSYEAVDGVASVTASGVMTQQVDITIEQSRIDVINSAILREIDSTLADTEDQLRSAKSTINSSKATLASARSSTLAKIDEAIASIDSGSASLPLMTASLQAQRDQLVPQLAAAQAALDSLDQVSGLTEEQKAQAMKIGETLTSLQAQRDALQQQLDEGGGMSQDALETKLTGLQTQRDQLAALRDSEAANVESLQTLDTATLEATISSLTASIATHNSELAVIRFDLESAITERDQAKRDLEDIDARIADLGGTVETPAPAATDAPAVTADITAEPEATTATAETETPEATTIAAETETPEATTAAKTEDPAATTKPVEESKPSGTGEAKRQTQGSLISLISGTAYAEGETLEELLAERVQVQARYDAAQALTESLTEQHDAMRDTLTDEQSALETAQASLDLLNAGELAVQDKIDAANARITQYDAQIAEYDAQILEITNAMSGGDSTDVLRASIASLDAQITAIKESEAYQVYLLLSDSSALESQRAQAASAVEQLTAAIALIDTNLDKISRGILPGGIIDGITEDTNLTSARAQLVAARASAVSQFNTAKDALDEASATVSKSWKEFETARDEALSNAGIDGIITVQTIAGILGSQNLDMPAGYVSDSEERYLVSVGTEFASLSELKETKLFSLGMDTVDDVRLLDVASVKISDNSADLFTVLNGTNGVILSFEKQSTASTAEVAKRVTQKSADLMAKTDGLHIVELMNQGDYINLIVDSVLQNLIYGGGLAILILLIFLMDWRPTLIIAISIPTSVVVAFVGMYFCGITLNVMSLSGLALGVGMLVDNSIVAIENIYRLLHEEKLPILTACIQGVNQVGGALFASTLTTVCIFLPIVFITGTARELFSGMGLTFAFALLASLLVSMTVVPSFSASLFRRSRPKKHCIFRVIQKGYTLLLRGALKIKWLVVILALAVFGYTVSLVPDMPMSLMPTVNSTQMQATLTFGSDTDYSDEEKQAIALNILTTITEEDAVTDVGLTSSSSVSMLSSLRGSGGGYSYYILVKENSNNKSIAESIRSRCAQYADGTNVILTVKESTMDLSTMMGSGISINIYGTDLTVMRGAAAEIAALCTQVEGAENIDDGSSEEEPKLIVTVDKELAKDNGLSVAQVYKEIATRLYGGTKLTSATLDGREYTLYVYTDKNIDLTPADVASMEIEVSGTNETKHVLISDIAVITDGTTLQSISRTDQKRTVTVSFDIASGYSSNLVSRDLEALLETYTPPEGCTIKLSGENENLMEYVVDLVEMMAVAILFIFLIMVAQFQSFKSPIIVMFTIPLAFTGGLLALKITNMDLSIIALVGFLMLSGVVVNNGIVFIDSINQLRIGGMSKKDAIIETGRIRLRPILMSALTTILGMSTMSMAAGMGAEMMQPMAVVTIGGLAYSTLMTLFVIPALYDMFNGKKMKAREIEMIKEASGMKREGFDV